MHKKDKDSYKGTTEINGFYNYNPTCAYSAYIMDDLRH